MAREQSSVSQDRAASGAALAKLSAMSTPRVRHALSFLNAKGLLGRSPSKKVSARLDPGLLEAARAKIGADNDTDLISGPALAIAAGDDDYGAWLIAQAGVLPVDFELEF